MKKQYNPLVSELISKYNFQMLSNRTTFKDELSHSKKLQDIKLNSQYIVPDISL